MKFDVQIASNAKMRSDRNRPTTNTIFRLLVVGNILLDVIYFHAFGFCVTCAK